MNDLVVYEPPPIIIEDQPREAQPYLHQLQVMAQLVKDGQRVPERHWRAIIQRLIAIYDRIDADRQWLEDIQARINRMASGIPKEHKGKTLDSKELVALPFKIVE